MVDLSVEYGNGLLAVGTLAEMQGISDTYLEQLIGTLKKADLVKAVRGAQGGYTLTRPPEKISVEEVLRALEGSTDLIDCVGIDSFDCESACSCSARPLWLKLQSRINEVLKTTTLKDMADDYITQKRRTENEKSLSR
jgi:Rrf2 family protein